MDPTSPHFACDVCNAKFTSRTNMMRHKRLLHGKTILHMCDVCGSGFSRLDNLKRHMKKFHGNANCIETQPHTASNDPNDKRFECCQCKAQFLCERDLEKHKLEHQIYVETILCHICGRVFDKKKFTRHLESHNDGPSKPSRKRQCESATRNGTSTNPTSKHFVSVTLLWFLILELHAVNP